MFESVSSFFEANAFWVFVGVFLLTMVKIAWDIFKRLETRKMAERGFRGAIPKIINNVRPQAPDGGKNSRTSQNGVTYRKIFDEM